jgi:hypothetical protein
MGDLHTHFRIPAFIVLIAMAASGQISQENITPPRTVSLENLEAYIREMRGDIARNKVELLGRQCSSPRSKPACSGPSMRPTHWN